MVDNFLPMLGEDLSEGTWSWEFATLLIMCFFFFFRCVLWEHLHWESILIVFPWSLESNYLYCFNSRFRKANLKSFKFYHLVITYWHLGVLLACGFIYDYVVTSMKFWRILYYKIKKILNISLQILLFFFHWEINMKSPLFISQQILRWQVDVCVSFPPRINPLMDRIKGKEGSQTG